jgi:hypothetical protein
MSDDDSADEITKGNALIRHYFKESPDEMNSETWAGRVNEALWLKRFEMRNLAELVSAMFKT